MPYLCTRTFDHNLGFNAVWRNFRSTGQARFLRGGSLAFKVIFESSESGVLEDLDTVVALPAREWLQSTFNNMVLVAEDDPKRNVIEELEEDGIGDVVIVPDVGLEAFAELLFDHIEALLEREGIDDAVRLHSVECREHSGSSALYAREDYLDEDLDQEPSFADEILEGDFAGDQDGDDLDMDEGQEDDGLDGPNR